ncbi:MAG: DUF6311 domain-containing protein [Saprospiraceae bacterium]
MKTKYINWLDIAFSVMIGLIFTRIIIGWDKLNPVNTHWLLLPGSDFSYHYLAWEYFKDTPWSWPLGRIQGYAYPMRNSVMYTDSIPIFAIIFKLFRSILPDDFQYFGIWHCLSYCLNTLFGVLIARSIGYNKWMSWLVSIFFTGAVVLIARFGHAALCGQWVILWALYVFIKRSEWQIGKSRLHLSANILVTSFIHPYLFFMIIGLCTAISFQLYKDGKQTIFQSIKLVLSFILIGLLGWYMSGAFMFKGLLSDGLGKFSANLNTFINAWDVGKLGPSFSYYGDGQGEGIGYLGLGILMLLLFISIYSIFYKRFKIIPIEINWFLIACIFFFIFALSPKWTLGNHLVIDWKYNDYISRTFRGTGRFIWPLYYFIFYWTFAKLKEFDLSKIALSFIIPLAFIIQTIDLLPLWKRNPYVDIAPPPLPYHDEMNTIISKAGKVIVYPPYAATISDFSDYIYFVDLAQHNSKPVTAGYGARFPYEVGARFRDSLQDFESYFLHNPKDIIITNIDSLDLHKHLLRVVGGKSFQFERYRIFVPNSMDSPLPDSTAFMLISSESSKSLKEYLLAQKNYIIAGAIQQEGRSHLSTESIDYFKSIGSSIDTLRFGGAWCFMVHKGKLLEEKISNMNATTLAWRFICSRDSLTFNLFSGGNTSNENASSITVRHQEHSFNKRGLNLAVFDSCGNLIDRVLYDSYLSDRFNSR